MGALKGSITYSKFRVEGVLPDDLHARYMARIRTRTFKQLTPEDQDDVSVGWVPIERPFDDEISFRSDGVFFGSYLNLGLRMDRWKFPTSLVKSKMAAAERAFKAKTGKERISRAEKAELRDAVERKLRRDGVPVTKTIDLSWNTETRELRLFGRSKVIAEHFHELFEKTFSMRLVVASPYTTGIAVGASKSGLDRVEAHPLHTGVDA
jgi:hypothetical protein